MNNYFTYKLEPTGTSCPANESIFDLWSNGAPARSLVGSGKYIEDLFLERMLDVIASFDVTSQRNLYIDYRPHSMHWPLMLPESAFEAFANITDDEPGCEARFYGDAMWPGGSPNSTKFSCRRQYQAMLSLLDAKVGAIVDALKARGLWDETYMSFFGDNGGCVELSENAGNNFPLRGGKYTQWDGGLRVPAFISGGYIPPSARGSVSHELVHVADHHVTICVRAGLSLAQCTSDALAEAGGLPPVDGIDFWGAVVLQDPAAARRVEVPVSEQVLVQARGASLWKLLLGQQGGAGWTGPVFPNATGRNPMDASQDCAGGCLFDVAADEGETTDLAAQQPELVANLTARLTELRAGFYSNQDKGENVCPAGTGDCACWAAMNVYDGFLGPWQKE